MVTRRAFLGTLAGGLLAAPVAAEAQQAERVYRMGRFHLGVAVMLLLLVNDSCASEVRSPSVTPSGTSGVTSVRGSLYRPDGPRPFPAMALFHARGRGERR